MAEPNTATTVADSDGSGCADAGDTAAVEAAPPPDGASLPFLVVTTGAGLWMVGSGPRAEVMEPSPGAGAAFFAASPPACGNEESATQGAMQA